MTNSVPFADQYAARRNLSCGRLGWWSLVDVVFRGPLEQAAGGGFKAVAYRLQERVLGGLFSPKNRGPDQRVPVILLRGARYRSLSEVARKITGTRWSGPRFFGLRAPTKRSDHGTR